MNREQAIETQARLMMGDDVPKSEEATSEDVLRDDHTITGDDIVQAIVALVEARDGPGRTAPLQ